MSTETDSEPLAGLAPDPAPPPAPVPSTDLVIRRCDVPAALTDMLTLAEALANAGAMIPGHLRRQPANILAVMFSAKALDIPLWTAIQSTHLVDGRVGYEASFQRALVIRAGHTFRVVERTDDRAVVGITRAGSGVEQLAEFTWAEAQAAQLAKKDNWQHYRRAMLVARATTIAVREITPEVLFGAAYDPDELGALTDAAGVPVTVVSSTRIDNPAGQTGRSAEAAAAMREDYTARIGAAETTEDLNEIWRDARRDGVLDAPLAEGVSVSGALHLRRGEILAATAAGEALDDGPPPDAPDADGIHDAVVVAEAPAAPTRAEIARRMTANLPPPADDAMQTRDTAARRGAIRALAERHGADLDRIINAAYGLPITDVSTAKLRKLLTQ